MDLNITQEELIEIAANKLADQYDGESLYKYATNRIDKLIKETVEFKIKERVDAFLKEEMEKIVNQEINPVNMWGEKTGESTSLKQILADQAREFWCCKVDKNGQESSYGGRPRYQVTCQNIMKEAFTETLKQSADTITAEFKKALITGMQTQVVENVNKLIKTA